MVSNNLKYVFSVSLGGFVQTAHIIIEYSPPSFSFRPFISVVNPRSCIHTTTARKNSVLFYRIFSISI